MNALDPGSAKGVQVARDLSRVLAEIAARLDREGVSHGAEGGRLLVTGRGRP